MRISKNQKNKYDTCIAWYKASGDDIDQAEKISCFPFLNWADEAKHFSEYCSSIGEDKIAEEAVKSWFKQ